MDPSKPKRPGGAARERAKKQARIDELLAEARSLGWKPLAAPVPLGAPSGDGADEFAALGPPPLEDPDTALAWVRRNQLVAMHLAASRPLSPEILERLKLVDKFAASIGMTQNRVELEELAERLEESLDRARPAGAVKVRPVAGHARPPGSRGTTAARGPRPVPPEGDDRKH